MTRLFTIGVLAKAAGVNASTIRIYETIGLLPLTCSPFSRQL